MRPNREILRKQKIHCCSKKVELLVLVERCSVADPSSHDALCYNTRFLSEEATKDFHVLRISNLRWRTL